jgi:hypothetical protein
LKPCRTEPRGHGAAQGEREHERHRDRHHPPSRQAERCEHGGDREREHDAERRAPVIADREVPHREGAAANASHAR